jgi:O-acetyl-ADP-ribose deacetylase (regulator of RNase III)
MTIELIQGDITALNVDAIVNAANSSLMGGGGVDGAIHRAGGKAILEECMQIRNRQGGCRTGEAVITTAGNMPSKKVIHTVGPIWNGHAKQDQELENCYINSIQLALEHGLRTIAFPNISTGVYRFPKGKAAQIAINAVKQFEDHKDLDQVIFVCFDQENYKIYEGLL